jgi:hypothetical protein
MPGIENHPGIFPSLVNIWLEIGGGVYKTVAIHQTLLELRGCGWKE